MRPDWRWAVATLAAAGAAAPRTAPAQSMLLRYEPRVGLEVRILSTVAIEMKFRDVVGEGVVPEGTEGMTFAADVVQSVTDRVLSVSRDVTVERTVDSTQVSLRALGIVQADPADPRLTGTARVRVSDRLELLDLAGEGIDTLPDVVTSALRHPIGYEVVLPEHPVGPGDRWTGTIRFPLQNMGDGAAGPALDTTLVAYAAFQIDSVVHRQGDTLAFIGVRGGFQTVRIEEARAGVAGSGTLTGEVSGTLVWSTGWSAFGTGALHALLEMLLDVESQGRHASVTLVFDVVNRFEIRP